MSSNLDDQYSAVVEARPTKVKLNPSRYLLHAAFLLVCSSFLAGMLFGIWLARDRRDVHLHDSPVYLAVGERRFDQLRTAIALGVAALDRLSPAQREEAIQQAKLVRAWPREMLRSDETPLPDKDRDRAVVRMMNLVLGERYKER